MSNRKVALDNLDGWGNGAPGPGNAIFQADTPFVDRLYAHPHAALLTSGENVGLPDGQMGNSEVGHLNIGAGRIVYQDLVRINKAIRDGSFFREPVLNSCLEVAKKENKALHLAGLVSDGGVHSHLDHLFALCEAADKKGLPRVYIHAFMDGRDTDPKAGLKYIERLEERIRNTSIRIASVSGRYYAMDRDKRWERIRLAYDTLVSGAGKVFASAAEGIAAAYANGVTDEFIHPFVIGTDGKPMVTLQPGDAFLCFNFRTDRCREITQVLTQQDMPDAGMKKIPLHYVTMTNYDDTFRDVHVIYDKDNLAMTLGEVLSRAGKTQVRIAETEKYPHVTFFFSGGREEVFKGERRLLVASPKVATYDLQPEMSAVAVTDAICQAMEAPDAPDFICLNYANADMVGHTGVFSAVVKAVETVDQCLQRVVHTGQPAGYSFLITADHGNADFMVNADGTPHTAHTTNPVPLFILDPDVESVNDGRLCDLAPTVLKLMGISKPEEMTGKSLID